MLKPKGFFKQVVVLELLIDSKNFLDSIELYLSLNRALQGENDLSGVEQKEAFTRLLYAYKAVRDAFFPLE